MTYDQMKVVAAAKNETVQMSVATEIPKTAWAALSNRGYSGGKLVMRPAPK